jgi:hypothetical protein
MVTIISGLLLLIFVGRGSMEILVTLEAIT